MQSKTPIRTKADILKFFSKASVPSKELLIGIEVERSAVNESDMTTVQYCAKGGYEDILKKLVEEMGWKILTQGLKGNITGLKRGGSEIHVEADGRLELVSKPRKGLFGLCREYEMHEGEINTISKEFGVKWVAVGRKPFSKTKEINFYAPENVKAETNHYNKYYPDLNKKEFTGFHKKNDGVHVNFGYTSESDGIEKFQTILKMSPILVAMFANSPIENGKFSGYMSKRNNSNLLVCPHRTDIHKMFFEKDFSFEKWVNYLLGLPMRRIERSGKEIFIPLTFAEYLENGYKKYKPRMSDFYLHIKSVWSELRIKHYLEYRAFDTVPPHLLPSIPAIIRAITRNSEVMQKCQNLVKDWTFEDHKSMRHNASKDALQAKTPGGGEILDLAKELLEIASKSLQENQKIKNHKVDTSRFLWPIKQYIFVREQSPAEYVMEMWNGEWHKDPRKLMEWSAS